MNKTKREPPEWFVKKLQTAVKEHNFKQCVTMAEMLRIMCGFRYHEICDYVQEHTGIEVAEWDSFMSEGEADESEDD
tara:strand:+ start:3044 stop:3274 length:231 start_codon:yes stop_codon:yes gene_type:complete